MKYTGWPKKNATLTINNIKKTRDRIKKLCALSRIEFFSQQDGTKNTNFAFKILYFKGFTEIPFADILKYHKI